MSEPFHSHRFPNGLTLVAEPLDLVRSAAFQFLVPAGAVLDAPGFEGTAYLLEGLSYRGAGSRNSREFSDALDGLGIHRGGGAELECLSFGGALLADDLLRALELYADLLRRPQLPEEQLDAERALALQKLARIEDNPAERMFVHLRREFYANEFGLIPLGSAESLARVTRAELTAAHAERLRPAGVILAVAGRFDWDRLRGRVGQLFGDWMGEGPALPRPLVRAGSSYRHVPQESNQEQIGLARGATAPGDPDYYNFRMAVEVLSGGPSARLHTEVREKRGLCYSVRAFPQAYRGFGALWAYAGTTPERCQETLDVLMAEIRRLREGVTEAEVERGRTLILSSLIMQSESTKSRVGRIARDQFLLGRVRPLDEVRAGIAAVTPESIREYLHRQPAPEYTVVTLGPAALNVGGG